MFHINVEKLLDAYRELVASEYEGCASFNERMAIADRAEEALAQPAAGDARAQLQEVREALADSLNILFGESKSRDGFSRHYKSIATLDAVIAGMQKPALTPSPTTTEAHRVIGTCDIKDEHGNFAGMVHYERVGAKVRYGIELETRDCQLPLGLPFKPETQPAQRPTLTPAQREQVINEMQEAHSAAYANTLVRPTVYYTAMEAALQVAEKHLIRGVTCE